MNSTPPAAISQTSLPSQNGPMAAKTVRRSASDLATNKCSTPAPKSKPSSTTYAINIKPSSANQSSAMGLLIRAVCKLATD